MTKSNTERLSELEFNQDKIIMPQLTEVKQYVDANKSGINLASLLNNRIITVVLAAIVAAGIYFLAKGTL